MVRCEAYNGKSNGKHEPSSNGDGTLTPAAALAMEARHPEIVLLGTMIRYGDAAVDQIRAIFSPADFSIIAHQFLARAIFRLRDRGEPIDAVTIANELKAAGHSADVRSDYLIELHGNATA